MFLVVHDLSPMVQVKVSAFLHYAGVRTQVDQSFFMRQYVSSFRLSVDGSLDLLHEDVPFVTQTHLPPRLILQVVSASNQQADPLTHR